MLNELLLVPLGMRRNQNFLYESVIVQTQNNMDRADRFSDLHEYEGDSLHISLGLLIFLLDSDISLYDLGAGHLSQSFAAATPVGYVNSRNFNSQSYYFDDTAAVVHSSTEQEESFGADYFSEAHEDAASPVTTSQFTTLYSPVTISAAQRCKEQMVASLLSDNSE